MLIGVTLYFTVFKKPNSSGGSGGQCFEHNIEYIQDPSPDYPQMSSFLVHGDDGGATQCQDACNSNTVCQYWTVLRETEGNQCYIKTKINGQKITAGAVSGPAVCSK